MTAQGGSVWTVDMCGNDTRSRKAAGIEDWDWDRGSAPHCHFDRSEVEWRNLPVILWLVASGWWLGKPYNHPDGRGKGGPLWWLAPPPSHRRKRVTGFSVNCVSLRIQFPCHPRLGRATKGKRLYGQARRLTSPDLHILCRMCTVGLWVLSVVLHDSDGSVERFILPLSGIITVEGNAV